MTFLVPVVMFGWIPVVIALFAMMPPRRAVIAAFLFAWLFLPMAGYSFQGLPNYTKMSATCAGVLLAATIFDPQRFLSFKPGWIDIPMLVWCLCPIATSLSNGLGLYDGFSAVLGRTIEWGLPYLIGRLYFSDLEGLRELAIGVFIGGLLYVPLCLYEIKMSPQLHRMVYGFLQHSWSQTYRFGGWRPMVFMQHGLMVGMWMITASLTGIWLWTTGNLKRLKNMPMAWLVPALVITTILCKSFGALALMVLGLGVLFAGRWTKTAVPVVCLVLVPALYLATRTPGLWSGDQLVDASRTMSNEERAESLQFRIDNENILAEKALRRPVFGWGGWGRNRVYNDQGRDISVTDGFWVIALGVNGLVGLISIYGAFLLPVALLALRLPPTIWASQAYAPLTVFCVLVILYMIDCIPNGMINPIFTLMCGGVSGVAATTFRIESSVYFEHKEKVMQGRLKQTYA